MEILDSANKILQLGTWYHTFEINNIKTKGTYDYTSLINELSFPKLDNMKVLDVGCSDGFFSRHFMEELGADYVLGVDINKYDIDVRCKSICVLVRNIVITKIGNIKKRIL